MDWEDMATDVIAEFKNALYGWSEEHPDMDFNEHAFRRDLWPLLTPDDNS